MLDEKLITNNICCGGSGIALVYCCSTVKDCKLRDKVLYELGISKDMFTKIKEKYTIKADVCFGDLAYCCSLEKDCRKRDRALKKLGMDRRSYIEYKRKIAEELYSIAGEKLFFVKALHTYVANILDIDSREEFRMILLGDGETFRALFSETLDSVKIAEGKILCVYLTKKELERLIELSRENGQSLTKFVRGILSSYLR